MKDNEIEEAFKLSMKSTGLSLGEAAKFIAENSCSLKKHDAIHITVGIHITSLLSAQKVNSLLKKSVFVHADGISAAITKRLFSGEQSNKIATTDLFPALIEALNHLLQRRVRLSIIGGDPGIAEKVATNLKLHPLIEVVDYEHGFLNSYTEYIDRNLRLRPEVILVGMGMPKELEVAIGLSERLPGSLFVTCGGLLRLLAGTENRAPSYIQKLNLEWLFRLATSPRRTATRYLKGALLMTRLLVKGLRK